MISSWSTCHKILHILMFITSFEEQNITYRSCSNLRIHLYIMVRAGYNPQGAVSFWNKVVAQEKQGTKIDFLSTHPTSEKKNCSDPRIHQPKLQEII